MLYYTRLDERALEELVPIMRAAFDDDSRVHGRGEQGGPPGYADGTFLRRWGIEAKSEAWVIRDDGRAVGGFIVFVHNAETHWLGTIFVSPGDQCRGIGHAIIRHIETRYPACTWRLETPVWATRNHRFYESCGFVRIQSAGDSVTYEKVAAPFSP